MLINLRAFLYELNDDITTLYIDLERTSKVSFANSKPENLRASCGLPQTSLDALQNAYAREMDSFDSVALFVEVHNPQCSELFPRNLITVKIFLFLYIDSVLGNDQL